MFLQPEADILQCMSSVVCLMNRDSCRARAVHKALHNLRRICNLDLKILCIRSQRKARQRLDLIQNVGCSDLQIRKAQLSLLICAALHCNSGVLLLQTKPDSPERRTVLRKFQNTKTSSGLAVFPAEMKRSVKGCLIGLSGQIQHLHSSRYCLLITGRNFCLLHRIFFRHIKFVVLEDCFSLSIGLHRLKGFARDLVALIAIQAELRSRHRRLLLIWLHLVYGERHSGVGRLQAVIGEIIPRGLEAEGMVAVRITRSGLAIPDLKGGRHRHTDSGRKLLHAKIHEGKLSLRPGLLSLKQLFTAVLFYLPQLKFCVLQRVMLHVLLQNIYAVGVLHRIVRIHKVIVVGGLTIDAQPAACVDMYLHTIVCPGIFVRFISLRGLRLRNIIVRIDIQILKDRLASCIGRLLLKHCSILGLKLKLHVSKTLSCA